MTWQRQKLAEAQQWQRHWAEKDCCWAATGKDRSRGAAEARWVAAGKDCSGGAAEAGFEQRAHLNVAGQ
jgi:hypothetical protein